MNVKSLVLVAVTSSIITAAATAMVWSWRGSEPGAANELSEFAVRLTQLEQRLNSLATQRDSSPQAVNPNEGHGGNPENEFQSTTTADNEGELGNAEIEIDSTDNEQLDLEQRRQQQRERRIAQLQPDYRLEQLRKNGFNDDEANRILLLESEVALEQLYDTYRYMKKQREENPSASSFQAQRGKLRERLGDELYERYLKANGRPTSVAIGTVLKNSPGYNAGLQAGDEIVAYAGKRVFNNNDLTYFTYQGNEGENVLMEVLRDGETIQLTLPRGPIGVRSGRY